jgi:hypothetical protein
MAIPQIILGKVGTPTKLLALVAIVGLILEI